MESFIYFSKEICKKKIFPLHKGFWEQLQTPKYRAILDKSQIFYVFFLCLFYVWFPWTRLKRKGHNFSGVCRFPPLDPRTCSDDCTHTTLLRGTHWPYGVHRGSEIWQHSGLSGNSNKRNAARSDLLCKATNTSTKAKLAKNTFHECFRATIKQGKRKDRII